MKEMKDIPNLDYVFKESLILDKIKFSQSIGIIPISDICNKFNFENDEVRFIKDTSFNNLEDIDIEIYILSSFIEYLSYFGIGELSENYLATILDIEINILNPDVFYRIVNRLNKLKNDIERITLFYIKNAIFFKDEEDLEKSNRFINLITSANIVKNDKNLFENSSLVVGVYNVYK